MQSLRPDSKAEKMNRTRQILKIAAVVAAAVMAQGCGGGSVQDARKVAADFANAYYSADYETAAGLCSPELEAMVRESGGLIDSLPEPVRAEFMELSRGMNAYEGEVHAWARDSVTVDFDILYPGEMEPMKTSLTVVRTSEDGMWHVVYAQERE